MTDHDPELLADPFIDWSKRADGRTHVLRKGTHYDRDPKLVRKAAAMWAHRHGYRCLSRHTDATVSVRLVPKQGAV
jgi:hypothetical protein